MIDESKVACDGIGDEAEASSMVGHVIGQMEFEVLLRLADFMTKKEAPRSTVGFYGLRECRSQRGNPQAPAVVRLSNLTMTTCRLGGQRELA